MYLWQKWGWNPKDSKVFRSAGGLGDALLEVKRSCAQQKQACDMNLQMITMAANPLQIQEVPYSLRKVTYEVLESNLETFFKFDS